MEPISEVKVEWKRPRAEIQDHDLERVLVIVDGRVELADINFGVFFDAHTGEQFGRRVQWWAQCGLPCSNSDQEVAA